MKIEFEALDDSGCIQFHSSTEINPHALLENSKSKEKIVRDKGEEWARGAVPALGKNLIETAINKELGDAVNDAAIQVSMAAWLYDSIYRGLNAETFAASNLRFTMMPDGSVKYDRFLSGLSNMSR